jgi:hypothetical protein
MSAGDVVVRCRGLLVSGWRYCRDRPGVGQAAGGLLLSEIVNPEDATIRKIAGVGVSSLGPLGSGRITSGRGLARAGASAAVAVLSSRYAGAAKLRVGSKVAISGVVFLVVGIVDQATAATGSNQGKGAQ